MALWNTTTRPPAVAGSFYPGSAAALSEQVQAFIDSAPKKETNEKLIGLIAPHAGYVYSGHVAGHAYRQLQGRAFDAVVLIGLSHRYPVRGAAVYARGAFRTPLGEVKIDEDLTAAIMRLDGDVEDLPAAHAHEHSLEVHLPFLQKTLANFTIVPILLQDDSPENTLPLAQAIAKAVEGRSALLIGSTDLSHYPVYDEARKADRVVIEAITRFDTDDLRRQMDAYMRAHRVHELHCMMCSTGAVYTTMEASRLLGGKRVEVLLAANSGDVPIGQRNQVVGYMAAAIYG
jgi:hypothetical protein